MKGVVIKSVGSSYTVLAENGSLFNCKLKGLFRIKELKTTNPVTVGDKVGFELDAEQGYGIISEIEQRKNYIIRQGTKLNRNAHIIASNLDQAILVATLFSPRTSTGFIDRFLVTAEAYNIKPVIVFNKLDMFEKSDLLDLENLKKVYADCGYQMLETSAQTGLGLNEFKELLKDKVSLITGHSGVGKSTLVNTIEPNLDLRIGEISEYHQKGTHTTTFAEMLPLSFGGFIIDTPGIKEFGLVDFDKYEMGHFFPDIKRHLDNCRFNNCIHVTEPGCAVRKAWDEGVLADFRYTNYINMITSEEVVRKHYE